MTLLPPFAPYISNIHVIWRVAKKVCPRGHDFCYNARMRIRGRKGQAAVEYVLALCALLAVVGAMWYLVSATKKSVVRTESLVSSDYP